MAMLHNDAATGHDPAAESRIRRWLKTLVARARHRLTADNGYAGNRATRTNGHAQVHAAPAPDPAVTAERKATGDAVADRDALRQEIAIAVAELDAHTAERDRRAARGAVRRPNTA